MYLYVTSYKSNKNIKALFLLEPPLGKGHLQTLLLLSILILGYLLPLWTSYFFNLVIPCSEWYSSIALICSSMVFKSCYMASPFPLQLLTIAEFIIFVLDLILACLILFALLIFNNSNNLTYCFPFLADMCLFCFLFWW